jgi:hypothetical protein
LHIVKKVGIEELAKKSLSLKIVAFKLDLLLGFRRPCLPLHLLNLEIDAFNSMIVLDLHRLKDLDDLLKGLVDIGRWVQVLFVHPDHEDTLYQVVGARIGEGPEEVKDLPLDSVCLHSYVVNQGELHNWLLLILGS